MKHAGHYSRWDVDLTTGQAKRDADVVHFDPGEGRAMAIAFIACGTSSLEERCLIAGEAADAIWATIDKHY